MTCRGERRRRVDARMADMDEIVHVVLVEWAEGAPADVAEQATRL